MSVQSDSLSRRERRYVSNGVTRFLAERVYTLRDEAVRIEEEEKSDKCKNGATWLLRFSSGGLLSFPRSLRCVRRASQEVWEQG